MPGGGVERTEHSPLATTKPQATMSKESDTKKVRTSLLRYLCGASVESDAPQPHFLLNEHLVAVPRTAVETELKIRGTDRSSREITPLLHSFTSCLQTEKADATFCERWSLGLHHSTPKRKRIGCHEPLCSTEQIWYRKVHASSHCKLGVTKTVVSTVAETRGRDGTYFSLGDTFLDEGANLCAVFVRCLTDRRRHATTF